MVAHIEGGRKRRSTDMLSVNDACKSLYITPPPHKTSRCASSQSSRSSQSTPSQGRPKALPVMADLCMLCCKNQHDSAFEKDTVTFCLANFAFKCFGKPVSGDAILLCRQCRESCISIGSAVDSIAKRGNFLADVSFEWLPRGPKSSVSRLFAIGDMAMDKGGGKTAQEVTIGYE